MRMVKGLAIGLIAAGLAGCGGGASRPSVADGSAGSATATGAAPSAGRPAPVSPKMLAGARASAARFYGLYSASQFTDLWNMLSPASKRAVSQHAWLGVHDACPGAGSGKSRTIRAVTVFGSAAIVTEAIAGAASSLGTAEDVFNYIDGKWSYSPADVGIYRHGSVAADVAAAKAAGFCSGWKAF